MRPTGEVRRRVDIVPHTHWDREWYSPFQIYRMQLVEVIDELLDLMEADPSYAHFHLDGQMAMVDDYLEIRPENEQRIRALGAAGRLACGPWYVLMDEFLVSAETIVRNLQLGIDRAAAFGGAPPIGYLPDMFGHIAQMPQILAQAGFEDAVVWRGVPAAVAKSVFDWEAPDGSRVRTTQLLGGYAEGAALADDPKALVRRIAGYEEARQSQLVGPILYMNGNDHQGPQPWLGRIVGEANGLQDDYLIMISSLQEALTASARDPVANEALPTWPGEMRSSANANLLMGVGSNRVDVKQAARSGERLLERIAEPLAALYLPPEQYPSRLFEVAWRAMIHNAAHDSICACSHDEVVDSVLERYREARQISEGVIARVMKAVAASFREAGQMVLNPSHRVRSGTVELLLSDGHGNAPNDPSGSSWTTAGAGPGTQLVHATGGLDLEITLSASQLEGVLDQFEGDQLQRDVFLTGADITEDDEAIKVAVRIGPERNEELQLDELRHDLLARVALRRDVPIRVRIDQLASRRVLARAEHVPGFGWLAWRPSELSHPVMARKTPAGATLENGLVTVVVDDDGTFAIDDVGGFGRLVDTGDHGDTYNFSPPEHDHLVDSPSSVEIRLVETGPVRAIAEVVATYLLPERIDDATLARVGEVAVPITTLVELHADERLVRVTTSFDNVCRDHRLRAWLPLPQPAAASYAECAFSITERGLDAEGGRTERGLATYPSTRFVKAGGLTVCHEGLCEYELVDIEPTSGGRLARSLALTLIRATGMLSRLTTLYRSVPAGPAVSLRGSQMLGPVRARYAIVLGDVDPYAMADDAFLPLFVAPTLGGGKHPPAGSRLTVTGGEVSSVRRIAGGGLEVRVFNPTPAAVEVKIGDDQGGPSQKGYVVDLRSRATGPFDRRLELAPWRFATIRLEGI